MGGSQSRSGLLGEEINLLHLLEIKIIIIIIISSSSSSSTVIVVEMVQVLVVVVVVVVVVVEIVQVLVLVLVLAVAVAAVDSQCCPSVEPNPKQASQFFNMRTERDSFSEIDVQKTSNRKCIVLPSEMFRIVYSKFFQ